MTETIVIQSPVKKGNIPPKPIQLEYQLENYLHGRDVIPNMTNPNLWNFIELIAKDYSSDHDLMFVYDDPITEAEVIFIWDAGMMEL